jgi:hypothetical protein
MISPLNRFAEPAAFLSLGLVRCARRGALGRARLAESKSSLVGNDGYWQFYWYGIIHRVLISHREGLLRSYHAELVKSRIDDYPFSDLCDGSADALFIIVASGSMQIEAGNERSTSLAVVIFERLLNAIEEENAWELLK